ncbi:MAG: aldo/keto reductase [Nitrospirota bacterium]|nr:aldo/keto reductase [Nitrospirota bacterium]
MQYRRLGKSGLQVSAIGLGSWTTYGKQVDEATAARCISAALDAGINLFDTAEGYADGAAEEIFGRTFKSIGAPRSERVICTKVYNGGDKPNQKGLSRKHILEGIEGSLRRLQADYVDLYLCHRPDFETPVEETVRAMDHLIRQGKVLYWGTSCWPRERIAEAFAVARRDHLTPPSAEQPPYNLLDRQPVEQRLAPLCEAHGLGLTTYSPLYGGILTGKYVDGQIPPGSRATYRGTAWLTERLEGGMGRTMALQVKNLATLAAEFGTTAAQVALAWCLKNRHVSCAITGASHPRQIADNLHALAVAEHLDGASMQRLDAIFRPLD